ncbi:hypothetical protein JCM10207_005498 [Rhodosporidiobolus poonsookiae]
MPFGSPLVPSPTITRSPPSSSSHSVSRSTSPALSLKPPATAQGTTVGLGVTGAGDLGQQDDDPAQGQVTSPLEMVQFVDTLLNDLESRFDSLSQDVLSRLNSLSTRVDSLETSLADLMSGTAGGPLPSLGASTGAGSAGTGSPSLAASTGSA